MITWRTWLLNLFSPFKKSLLIFFYQDEIVFIYIHNNQIVHYYTTTQTKEEDIIHFLKTVNGLPCFIFFDHDFNDIEQVLIPKTNFLNLLKIKLNLKKNDSKVIKSVITLGDYFITIKTHLNPIQEKWLLVIKQFDIAYISSLSIEILKWIMTYKGNYFFLIQKPIMSSNFSSYQLFVVHHNRLILIRPISDCQNPNSFIKKEIEETKKHIKRFYNINGDDFEIKYNSENFISYFQNTYKKTLFLLPSLVFNYYRYKLIRSINFLSIPLIFLFSLLSFFTFKNSFDLHNQYLDLNQQFSLTTSVDPLLIQKKQEEKDILELFQNFERNVIDINILTRSLLNSFQPDTIITQLNVQGTDLNKQKTDIVIQATLFTSKDNILDLKKQIRKNLKMNFHKAFIQFKKDTTSPQIGFIKIKQ